MHEHEEHPEDHAPAGWAVLGTCALLFAASIVCLAFLEVIGGVSIPMPRSWYTNRPVWYFLGFAAAIGGWYLLRPRREPRDAWKPERSGVRFERLVLYTRDGCHLCDQARDTLLKYAAWLPAIEEVNIDADPHLVGEFGTCVPVVALDEKIRFRGRVDEWLLRRLIEGTPPAASPARLSRPAR